MNIRFLQYICLALLPFGSACQTVPTVATEAQFERSSKLMAPHFECANYYSTVEDSVGIGNALDAAALVGEDAGLSPGQIMRSYRGAKKSQEMRILNRATTIASRRTQSATDDSYLPNEQDERQAWIELYAQQCE